MEWAKAHPYLTTFFVLPAILFFPVRMVMALRGKDPDAPTSAPAATGGPQGARLMPLDM